MVYYKGKKPLRYKKKATTKRKVVKKAIKKANNRIFAKKVLKVVKRQEETKYAQPLSISAIPIYAYNDVSGTVQPVPFTSTFIELTSIFNTVGQGTGQGGRIGNKISPVNFVFKGIMSATNASADGTGAENPTYVKMIICRMKNAFNAKSIDMSNFFQFGNGAIAPSNRLQDIYNQINRDEIVVYATRTFKLGASEYGAGYNQNNNDFKLCKPFKVNLTKWVKNVCYNDTGNITNHQMFAVFVAGMYNGYPIPASTASPPDYPVCAGITYDIQLAYKDS